MRWGAGLAAQPSTLSPDFEPIQQRVFDVPYLLLGHPTEKPQGPRRRHRGWALREKSARFEKWQRNVDFEA